MLYITSTTLVDFVEIRNLFLVSACPLCITCANVHKMIVVTKFVQRLIRFQFLVCPFRKHACRADQENDKILTRISFLTNNKKLISTEIKILIKQISVRKIFFLFRQKPYNTILLSGYVNFSDQHFHACFRKGQAKN
jgi:hypothetical protein